jgi:hypothetical protein
MSSFMPRMTTYVLSFMRCAVAAESAQAVRLQSECCDRAESAIRSELCWYALSRGPQPQGLYQSVADICGDLMC